MRIQTVEKRNIINTTRVFVHTIILNRFQVKEMCLATISGKNRL